MGQVLALLLILGNRWHTQTLGHIPERQCLSFDVALCNREFEYFGIVHLLEVLALPFSSRVLAHDLGLRESDVVQLPLGGDFGDVAQVHLYSAALVNIADAEIQLIHGLVVLAWLLSQENNLRSQQLAMN